MSTFILGDKKRVRYDEGLIDIVNKKYAKEISSSEEIILDSETKLESSRRSSTLIKIKGKIRTRREWSEYCNKHEILMANTNDFYQAGKFAPKKTLKFLREGFSEDLVVSDTVICYCAPHYSHVQIISWSDSNVSVPIERHSIFPEFPFQRIRLDYALTIDGGLSFFQSLFDTTDDEKIIKETLERLSNKKASDITIWIEKYRNSKFTSIPIRRDVRFLYTDLDEFSIAASEDFSDVGRAYKSMQNH